MCCEHVCNYECNQQSFGWQGGSALNEAEAGKLKLHYSRLFYRAVSHCTKAALRQIKQRIGSKASGGFLFLERPFFDVNVELAIPSVVMSPSLDDIQQAINRSCRAIIGLSKNLHMWGSAEEKGRPMHDVLASDKEIVRTVLLLTGSMEGAKRQVYAYLNSFAKYDWLWQGNMQAEYAYFMSRKPNLDEFETELKKYVELEREIAHISPVHNIGALSLETAPLKYSLRSECLAWKALYGNNLHEQAKVKLEGDMTTFRNRPCLSISNQEVLYSISLHEISYARSKLSAGGSLHSYVDSNVVFDLPLH